MAQDSASRKWQITINNPVDKGFTHDRIKELLKEFKKLVYWCMSDEVGEQGTYHTHLYLASSAVIRFSMIKKRFDGSHFEMAKGTSDQNRDYVFKEGKWVDDKKKETNLPETHEEWGDCPVERQGARNDIHDLYSMIKEGMTNYQILEENADYMMHLDKVERVRQTLKEEQYKTTWRDLEVTYIQGTTGSGKTRHVMELYGYDNVYRVTDYDHPFDGYKGEDVVLFEEFRSSLKVQDMLNYLDGYPVVLPCRYLNKVACFTKVYIASNNTLMQQYEQIQRDYTETWLAFLRRINKVVEYTTDDIHNYTISEYMTYLEGWHKSGDTPFKR